MLWCSMVMYTEEYQQSKSLLVIKCEHTTILCGTQYGTQYGTEYYAAMYVVASALASASVEVASASN